MRSSQFVLILTEQLLLRRVEIKANYGACSKFIQIYLRDIIKNIFEILTISENYIPFDLNCWIL